jgi:DNA-directed RNA polymerase subunit RPC12/RpoP
LKVIFACPSCEQTAAAPVQQASDWQCDRCDHRLHLNAAEAPLPTCVVCGNHELYKKKDFPHWLGMTILVTALILSTVTYYSYEKWWSWSFLIGSAIIDGVMYLMVGDVIVCYRCESHYHGFTAGAAHEPFEISIGERYRQEKIRKEQMKSNSPRKT